MTERARVGNAADPKQVKEAQRRDRLEDEQSKADLAELGESQAFVRYMVSRIERCGVYTTSFSSDPALMAFNEGQRNVGLILTSDLERANPMALVDLMRARILKEQQHNG